MNRLTRKTNEKDFVSKERVYYMHYDENTPEKFLEKYPFTTNELPRWIDINAYISKLGRLEDLEEQLGCPLEVVFEALDKGVCADVKILDLETIDTIERPRLYYSDDFECYCFELLFGEYVIKLKDYGKTWFLKGEKCD